MFSAHLYDAAQSNAAFLKRPARGLLLVSGADRGTYLHGLLTNDVAALKAGQGCYAAYLTPQGRMIADMHIHELGDVILLVTQAFVKDTVLAKLDQFIFSEDVQLGDASAAFSTIAVLGPTAAEAVAAVVAGLGAADLAALAEHGCARASFGAEPVIVTRIGDLGTPGFDLYVDGGHVEALAAALAAGGVVELDAATANVLRVEGRVPLFGVDMDDDTIPLEAGIEQRAISFNKGCYVGQEVIIRVLHRGHGKVARKLAMIEFEPAADVPAPGAIAMVGEREAGRLTSTAWSPQRGRAVALAMLHRDFLEPGTAVTIAGQPAHVAA